MSALRSFSAWLATYEVMLDAPAAFKAERLARGETITSAARQMIAMSAYRLRNFEEGRDVPASDLRTVLLWMAAGQVPNHDIQRQGNGK